LSSYFDGVVEPHVYVKPSPPASEPQLVLPMVSEVYRGILLVFPRDALAARWCFSQWNRDDCAGMAKFSPPQPRALFNRHSSAVGARPRTCRPAG